MNQPFKIFNLDDKIKSYLKSLLPTEPQIDRIRASVDGIGNPTLQFKPNEFKSFEEFENKKNELIKEYKPTLLGGKNSKLSQIWYSMKYDNTRNHISGILKNIIKENYNIEYPMEFMWELTMFTEDCYIEEHIDGNDSNRLAGILIYLNEDYDKENGGLLKVTDPITKEITEVVPEFGQVVIIDYTKHSVSHEVTPIKKGKRLAICAFIHKLSHMAKSKKVLVTGASGFIGSQLVKTLNEKGYWNIRTTSFGRDLPSSINNINNIEHFKGDLRDAEFCEMVTKDVDVIFHLAANTSNALDTKFNPLLHVTPNIEMNVNLMEQAWRNSVKKFVFISSNTTYPDMGSEFCTEDINVHATPMLPVYKAVGGMKRYGEMLCDFFSNQIHNPMQCVIIRPSNAFGPNDKFDFEKCHVTPANIRKVADGLNPIPVWGDGTEVRDLLHVEDMAEGILWVAESTNEYGIYNVCYGSGYSVNEVLNWLKEMDNNTNPVEYVNNKAPMIPVRLLSSEKVNKLGWKPKRDLKEALKETLEWYKVNKHLYNPNSKP